ncbi:MAG: peptidylprolyl isomerase [Rhodocyclaceae bacterium]
MKRFPSRLALTLIAGLFAHTVFAAEPVATVNGQVIPAARASIMMDEQRTQGATETPQLRDAIREELIRREVLAQAAVNAGLDKGDDVKAQMDLARQAVLIRAYLMDYVQNNPVTDIEIIAEYESIKNRMGGKEYKPRHVLVETEDQAKAIIAKLAAGESFEELAKQSMDPGSKERGGELGWSNPGMFVKPFSEAMVALEKGKYTTAPVKSDFGYHVILLDDIRDMEAPPLDEVKPQLQQRLQQQRVEQHLLDLRAKADVK